MSQADSISDVGQAMNKVASALTAATALATPVRRQKALGLLGEDGEYSSEEEDAIMDLFTDHINIADIYTGIQEKDKRVKYVRGQLAKKGRGRVDFE